MADQKKEMVDALAGQQPASNQSIDPTTLLAILAGPAALTADREKLEQATALDRKGYLKPEIYDKTGWFKGFDGKWRFEIPDIASDWKPHILNQFDKINPNSLVQIKGGTPVGNMYDHPELFAAYPHLSRIPINQMKEEGGAVYNAYPYHTQEKSGMIEMGPDRPYALKPTLMHEFQHGVQHREGFHGGANPDWFEKLGYPPSEADKLYWNTTGEVEARNVANRSNYKNENVLKSSPPWTTEDVPKTAQIKGTVLGWQGDRQMPKSWGFYAPGQRITDLY